MNKMKELRKQNNKLVKLLTSDHKAILTDITCYLRFSDIYDEQVEEIRQDLLYMFMDAEQQKQSIQDRIGDDVKVFCDAIIDNAPKKTRIEKCLSMFEIIVGELFLLSTIAIAFEFDYARFFDSAYVPKNITLSLYHFLYFTVILLIPLFSLHYLTKSSLLSNQRQEKEKKKLKIALLSGAACAIISILLSLSKFAFHIIVPTSFIMIFIFLCVISYVSIQVYRAIHQKHIAMTKTLS